MDNIELLESLGEKQTILETTYLEATVAKEIKLKRRVKNLNTDKFRMVNLPLEQIKQFIHNVIKPENDMSENVESSLAKLFSV